MESNLFSPDFFRLEEAEQVRQRSLVAAHADAAHAESAAVLCIGRD